MSEETSFMQWRDAAKEERKRTGAGVVIAWVVGVLVVLAVIAALVVYL